MRNILLKDYEKTGQCRCTVAKESYWPTPYGFAISKGNPYTEIFNRGYDRVFYVDLTILLKANDYLIDRSFDFRMMEINEYGLRKKLRNLWYDRPRKDDKCFQQTTNPPVLSRLTVKHLASVLVLLGAGYIISILVFFGERITHRYQNHIKNSEISNIVS